MARRGSSLIWLRWTLPPEGVSVVGLAPPLRLLILAGVLFLGVPALTTLLGAYTLRLATAYFPRRQTMPDGVGLGRLEAAPEVPRFQVPPTPVTVGLPPVLLGMGLDRRWLPPST
jgi:hypothetical protein